MSVHIAYTSGVVFAAIHQTKPSALEVKRINVLLEHVHPLRRIARAKRTQKRFQRLMCEHMPIVGASCTERFVAVRTLFFVVLALLALVLGELVFAQSTKTRIIFLALIAFVSFLFMNTLNVPSQNWASSQTLFDNGHKQIPSFSCAFLCLRTRAATFLVLVIDSN